MGRLLWPLLAFVTGTAVATPLAFWLAILIVPSRTAEGHGLMPIGQAAFAMVCGPALGIALAIWTWRRSPSG